MTNQLVLGDAEGGLWLRDYDDAGNLVETVDPLGNKTEFAYTSTGLLKAIKDANGNEKKLVYNDAGQLLEYTDCSGKTEGKSPEEVSRAVAPPPGRPIMTGECRGSLMAAMGTGFSVTVKANEVSGLSGELAVPMIAAGARAAASCGIKFADADAKSLPAAAGIGFSLGAFTFAISQISTWPEVYIGVGPGVGPELKTPVAPAVAVPLF